jgi:hypothetical protein
MPKTEKEIEIVYWGGRRPRGWVFAHNRVSHSVSTPQGARGFRAFYVPPSSDWVKCTCGWRPDLGVHYRHKNFPVKRLLRPEEEERLDGPWVFVE